MCIVIELQKNTESVVSNLITSHNTLTQVESKFYSTLTSAAVNEIPIHSAIIVSKEGFPVKHQCYKH